MKKTIFLFVFALLTKVLHCQVNPVLTQYKDKGDEYAILYYELRGGPTAKDYIKVVYSNETPDTEDLLAKFKMNIDTLSRAQTYQVLEGCFKYLNTKGYKFISSAEKHAGVFYGHVNKWPYWEYIFVKPSGGSQK